MTPRPEETWEAFGYSSEDAAVLEGVCAKIVSDGLAPDLATARRAVAAVTFLPTAREKGALAGLRFRRNLRNLVRRSRENAA